MLTRRGTIIRTTATVLAAIALGFTARAEDRIRIRLGTTVAKEAQPKPPRTPRPPDLRGTIVDTTKDTITIETPANTIKKTWTVPTEDILEVFLDGEPEELRSARGMVAAGDGTGALEQLAPGEDGDRATQWEEASDAVRAERMFVKSAANAQIASRSGEHVEKALAGLREYLTKHPRSHHAAFMRELEGDLLARTGKPEDAIKAYMAIATDSPAWRVRSGRLQGSLQLDRAQWADARESLEKAIATESPPGDFSASLEKRDARLLLVRCLARDGHATDAITLARQMLSDADPADGKGLAMIFVVLGEAQRAAGDRNKEALVSYLTVDLVHNGVPEAHAEALAGLVELWEKENHPERAREVRQTLEQTYPNSPWLQGSRMTN